jgi:heme exporter protein D
MDFHLLANQIWGSLSQFFSQLGPSVWLQVGTTLIAAIIAVAGAVLAANAAYRNVNKSRFAEAEAERRRTRTSERDRVLGTLHALREEILQLWMIIAEDLGGPIENLDLKRKPLPYWSYNQSYFSVFDRNAGTIGLIENDQLRSSLVRTYMFAKRLVDQYQGYNRMDVRASVNSVQPASGASADTTYALHAGALTLIESYNALKTNVDQVRNLLDAELGLKKTPLPYIDSTEPGPAAGNRGQAKEAR